MESESQTLEIFQCRWLLKMQCKCGFMYLQISSASKVLSPSSTLSLNTKHGAAEYQTCELWDGNNVIPYLSV